MAEQTNNQDAIIEDSNLYMSFRLMKQKDYDGAENLIKEGLVRAEETQNTNMQGLYYSAMGVLYKLKEDYKKSYKFYQQAEKLLKDDLSVKIISAILLRDQFKQYDTAIRKMQKVIEATQDPAIWHRAQGILASCYLLKNQKDKAKKVFQEMLAQDFLQLRQAANVDFEVVEIFIRKNFEIQNCQEYLEKSLNFVKQTKEKIYESVITVLLELIQNS